MMRIRLRDSICLALIFLASCSTTKNIPDDDQLFVGLKKIDYQAYEEGSHFEETQEEIEAALATAPNGALFGSSYYRTPFPYGLWIWNWADGSHGKIKKWMKKSFGKAPVLMSQVNPALRASVARSVLRNHGYLHGNVSYELMPLKGKTRTTKDGTVEVPSKKAKIAYTVRFDSLMVVDTLTYAHFPAPMQQLIDSTMAEAKVKSGTPFAVSNLDAERTRIAQLLRNNGYYYYQPSYASYLADTFDITNHVQLRLQMADSLPSPVLKKWYVGKINIELRHTPLEQLDSTLGRRFLNIRFNGKRPPVRPGVILRDLKLRSGKLFNYDDYAASMQTINASDVFSSVDFQFTPRTPLNSQLSPLTSHLPPLTSHLSPLTSHLSPLTSQDTLDLTMSCILDKPYDFYVETNVVNRTIGRMGPELKVGLTRRNAFRGGERLDINLHGAYEWQTTGQGSDLNSYQYGADASVEFPRIVLPWDFFSSKSRTSRLSRDSKDSRASRDTRKPRRRYYATPWTVAKVSSDIVRRPNYYKMHIVSGEWAYRWQPSETSRHELSPLTLKYQYMNSHTQRFDSLMGENPYLLATMNDYFIPKMRYTYTYASPKTYRNPIRWETSIEEAGNLTALYDVVIQGNGWNQREKTLFKNVYSQFVRFETDLTKTWTIDMHSQLVGHLNYGILWTFGNTKEAPFSELFYVGGANSIRAFPVRSIGPGAFPGIPGNHQFSYLMQNGDVKMVMNLEYRRRLFGSLYGAVFLDAGNVWNSADWTISKDDDTDEDMGEFVDAWNKVFGKTRFNASRFLKEIATGTGIGLRYDLDFLILRVDWGFGLHLPYPTNKSGYLNIPRFKDMHTLHIAIGYPF